jgi:hypothetical protein
LKTITTREAVIQAHIELGLSREEAESKAKSSDGFLPGAGALTENPVIVSEVSAARDRV